MDYSLRTVGYLTLGVGIGDMIADGFEILRLR